MFNAFWRSLLIMNPKSSGWCLLPKSMLMFSGESNSCRCCCGLGRSSRAKSLTRTSWETISSGVSSSTDPGRVLETGTGSFCDNKNRKETGNVSIRSKQSKHTLLDVWSCSPSFCSADRTEQTRLSVLSSPSSSPLDPASPGLWSASIIFSHPSVHTDYNSYRRVTD